MVENNEERELEALMKKAEKHLDIKDIIDSYYKLDEINNDIQSKAHVFKLSTRISSSNNSSG